MSRRVKKPGARGSARGPSTSVQALSPEEKLSKALELAHEAAYLYADKQFAECCVILQGEMTADLLACLPPKLAFTCRLQFNFSLFFISPINGHIVFDQGTKDRAQDVWLGAWCMPESCFTPQTLLTITETLFAFAIDLTLYDSQRSTLSDVSRIIEHYLILDPREINGYNAVLADKWYSTIKECVPGCYASPSFRETLMGPGMSENHLLLELLPPNLVVPMLYFAMIRHKDVLDETRYDATQWYGSLVSYCKYNNYPYSRTHSLLAYRIFTGERHYNIRWDIQHQKDILHPHTCGVQLPAEFLNSAQAAFAAVAGGDYTKTAHLFDKCQEILAEKALSLDRFEKLVVASQAGEATKQQLSQRLLDSKHRHLRLVRDIHLNRALFALGLHENDPTADVTPAWEHLKLAIAVSPSPEPYSVKLLPLNASTLLNFANSAMALEKYSEAIDILEHLLTVQEDIAVFHRLGDCYLRRFLDLSGDDGRIEAETTFSAWKGKESVSSETLQGLLAKALEAYQETRRRLRSLAGIGVHQIENDNAMVQFREYQEAVFQPEQGGTSSGTTKGKIKKKANKEAETDGQEKNLANELAENYSAMHFTFLEEMYIQTTLSIVYCLLWQRRYEKVLTELLPLRTNCGLSFCSPYALSKSAFLCASLYAGEAKYEMGNGQTASENFDLAGLLQEFTVITSKNTAEDPHARWRGGLHRDRPLPYCTDKGDEDLISKTSLLEGLFSYNYLTALVNMGRSERTPGRLARLRPSAITSRGCLALFAKYPKLLDTRLAQLRESLTAGRFDATLEETTWSWILKDIKGRGHRLPDCIPVEGLVAKKSKKKKQPNTGCFQPLNSEEADLVLMAARYFSFPKKRPIPADPDALSFPGPLSETSVVASASEGTSRKLLTSGTSTLELIDKFKLARTLAFDAYGYFSSQNYAECYRSLEEEMTGELLDFLPHHDEIDVLMVHNLSHYAISCDSDGRREEALVFDRLKGVSTEKPHWNVVNLLDNETLSAVAEHIYNFAVKLNSSKEGEVDSNIEDAGILLEQFLWMDLNSLPYFQDAQADGDFVWVHLQAGLPRKTDTFFRVSVMNQSKGQVAWPLVEALDAPLATKMMVWLFFDLNEMEPFPEWAFELYENFRTYLYYTDYQIPEGLALIQYRLFTGLTFFSIQREMEIQERRFLKIVHVYLELPEDFVMAVFEPFKAYNKRKDYDTADRLWLECDRLLRVKKEELDRFETMVQEESDEALRSSLGERLIEAKAKYLGVYADIRLFRAMLALDRYATKRTAVQPAFELFQEALTVDSGPGTPYPATPVRLNITLPLQFANNAMALSRFQTAIDILERLLPVHESKPMVSHRLGDCYLRQYLDLIQDDARIAHESAHWRGDTEEDFPQLPQATIETANGKLEKALEYYRKAQQLVRTMIEEKTIEREEKEANGQYTKNKQSFLKLRGEAGWGARLQFNCQVESWKMREKMFSEESKADTGKCGNSKKANSKKSKGKNGKRNSGKNTGKWRKDEASTSKAEETAPEEVKVEPETEKHQKFGAGSSEDYQAIQHTFLEEMYVQLSINIAYCLLSQRRYQDAVMEASQFHYRTSRGKFTLSPYALSPGNFLLTRLYMGIAFYERAVGHFDFDSFDYQTVVKEFAKNRENAPFSVPSFYEWRSYLQGGDPVEGLRRLPNCSDGSSTADHGRTLEAIFAYNFLTALANCSRDRRLPYGLARPRPNSIASKGTLKLFAHYEKMLEYRWRQLRESLEEGRHKTAEGDAGSAWRRLLEPERAEKIPKCIAEQLARQGEAPLTPEQVNDLEGAMFESYSRGGIPADAENGPPVPAEWEVRELAKEEEKARKKLHSKVELKAEVHLEIQAEAEEQSQESAEELAEESDEETSTQSAKSEALSEESEPEEDEVSEPEFQSENPSIENVQNGAEESKVSNEDDLIQNESLQKPKEETVLKENETEQPAPVMEATQSETSPTVEVETHSSFEFLEMEEPAVERQLTEQEEVIVKPEMMMESKWSQLDEQLEMGADDEDDDDSEGSGIWDSVNQEDDFDDYFDETEEWDNPQETVENGTFFGLPPVVPSQPELLTVQPELDPYLQPAVKVSSTAKSQSAQAAASELGNLLSKFSLASTRKSQSPLRETLPIISEPTQPHAAPFTFPPPPEPPALVSSPPTFASPVLVDLSANNSSLGPCLSTKAAKEPVYSVPPITTTLSPSNMFDIGEFNPFPTSNQSLLDRYMREPPTSDCASSKAPTPPLGGFPFGPIGRPASKPADLLDSLLDEAAEEDDDDPSAQYMKLSHHFALMAHHEKEKKAQEEKVQQLLAQMRRQREKRETSQKGAGLAPNPQQLPHLPNWEQPQQQQQPTPNLNQNGRSSMFPSHLPEAPAFAPFQASASSSSLFGHLQPQSANSLLGMSASGHVPTTSNSFGLSIDLNADYFATPPPIRPTVSPNLCNFSAPFGVAPSQQAHPFPPPSGVLAPEKPKVPTGQPSPNATLAELFDAFQTK